MRYQIINHPADLSPGGTPASSAIAHRANAVKGVSSDGFKTTVQPAANAGPIFLVITDSKM